MRVRRRHHADAIDVDDSALLGEGGEGRVFAAGTGVAVKLYHPHTRPSSTHQRKIERLCLARRSGQLRGGLLDSAVFPDDLIDNDAGDFLGVSMARVDGAVELASLAPQRRPAQLRTEQLRLMLIGLIARVDALHAAGVVVGDLNDGNVLVGAGGAGDAVIIDTDSVQFEGFVCPVAHERTLDPRLYGLDLSAAPAFSPLSDHYALRVLALLLLCGVHPYGGVHAAHPTLLRRAAARLSVFRDDVMLPKSARPLSILSDELRADLVACFDGDARAPLRADLLARPFVRCACGLEHARSRCPACAIVVRPSVVHHSAQLEIAAVSGAGDDVVAAGFDGGLRSVYRHVDGHGHVSYRREDGSVVVDGDVPADLSFFADGPRTWMALPSGGGLDGAALVCVNGGVVVDRTSTGLVYGAPALAVSRVGLIRLSGDAIVHHDSGQIMGRALLGATALFATDDGCLAVWRAGRVCVAMWCRPGSAPSDVALPPVDGKVRLMDVASSGDVAVITMLTEDKGVARRRCTVCIAVVVWCRTPTSKTATPMPPGFAPSARGPWWAPSSSPWPTTASWPSMSWTPPAPPPSLCSTTTTRPSRPSCLRPAPSGSAATPSRCGAGARWCAVDDDDLQRRRPLHPRVPESLGSPSPTGGTP